ncbi:MAG: hypothetical protein IJ203_02100 [Atopobiaceae bacterium]|nr:hypothetical protein [Atopobiaceae bacterium]
MLRLLLLPFELTFKCIVWPFKAVSRLMFGVGKSQTKKSTHDLGLR